MTTIFKFTRSWIFPALLLLLSSFSVAGNWPQEVPIDGGSIVVYQPQRPQTSHHSQFDQHSMNRDFNARQRGGGMNRRRR